MSEPFRQPEERALRDIVRGDVILNFWFEGLGNAGCDSISSEHVHYLDNKSSIQRMFRQRICSRALPDCVTIIEVEEQ